MMIKYKVIIVNLFIVICRKFIDLDLLYILVYIVFFFIYNYIKGLVIRSIN